MLDDLRRNYVMNKQNGLAPAPRVLQQHLSLQHTSAGEVPCFCMPERVYPQAPKVAFPKDSAVHSIHICIEKLNLSLHGAGWSSGRSARRT